ncbi:MAG: hypothetical protein R3E12_10595 [Candidatus Eisenbacteria bacterium]
MNFLDMIHADQLTGASAIIVEFYLAVTGGPSDEDCSFDSQWGAFGIDNVIVAGGAQASFDFEDGPQGWETLAGGLNRDPQLVFEVRDLAAYGRGYENWMDCPLDANVMTLHGPGVFQEETLQGATSPIIDLTGLGDPHITGFSVTWDELRDYAGTSPGIESRIYYRTYPRPCATGAPPRWSNWELAFQDGVSGDEGCLALADNFWSGAQGVPDFLQVHVAVWTCAACCPIYCEGADVTPFFDNLQVCMRLAPSDVEDHEAAGDLGVRLSSQPVSPRSTARLGQQARGEVGVDLFSASGRRLAALFRGSVGSDSELPIGSWLDEQGLTPGLYFVRFHTETSGETVKVVWAP